MFVLRNLCYMTLFIQIYFVILLGKINGEQKRDNLTTIATSSSVYRYT